IFIDRKAVLLCNDLDLVDHERMPVQVNRHDALRAGRDRRAHRCGIEREVIRFDIREYGCCTGECDGVSRRRECERGNDDFVAWTHSRCEKAEMLPTRSRVHCDSDTTGSKMITELPFECRDFGTLGDHSRMKHPVDGFPFFITDDRLCSG